MESRSLADHHSWNPTGPVDIARLALRRSIPTSSSAPGAILPPAPLLSLEGRQHA